MSTLSHTASSSSDSACAMHSLSLALALALSLALSLSLALGLSLFVFEREASPGVLAAKLMVRSSVRTKNCRGLSSVGRRSTCTIEANYAETRKRRARSAENCSLSLSLSLSLARAPSVRRSPREEATEVISSSRTKPRSFPCSVPLFLEGSAQQNRPSFTQQNRFGHVRIVPFCFSKIPACLARQLCFRATSRSRHRRVQITGE